MSELVGAVFTQARKPKPTLLARAEATPADTSSKELDAVQAEYKTMKADIASLGAWREKTEERARQDLLMGRGGVTFTE